MLSALRRCLLAAPAGCRAAAAPRAHDVRAHRGLFAPSRDSDTMHALVYKGAQPRRARLVQQAVGARTPGALCAQRPGRLTRRGLLGSPSVPACCCHLPADPARTGSRSRPDQVVLPGILHLQAPASVPWRVRVRSSRRHCDVPAQAPAKSHWRSGPSPQSSCPQARVQTHAAPLARPCRPDLSARSLRASLSPVILTSLESCKALRTVQ